MKTILVDDEPMALEVLEQMLSPYEEINIIGRYTRPVDALKSIKEEKPDIIFLDIEMGDLNGLEVAEIFMRELDKVEIVFVTAYSQYAVDAFEINAIDYLLKPIQENRLFKAIKRLRKNFDENQIEEKKLKIPKDKLKVYSFGGFQVLDNMGNPLTWRTQKSKELFAYLWVNKERPASKVVIMETIFPDRNSDKASTLLHTTIYQIRKGLERLGYSNGIIFFDESYQLNIPIISDVDELNKLIGLRRYNDRDIVEVLKIYRGELLEEGYNWAIEMQQRYRILVFKILERYARDQIENRIFSLILKISLDKAYEIDSYNESIADMMIHYYGKQRKICSLEIFFKDYSERLWQEMNLKPMDSTIDIYKRYMEEF